MERGFSMGGLSNRILRYVMEWSRLKYVFVFMVAFVGMLGFCYGLGFVFKDLNSVFDVLLIGSFTMVFGLLNALIVSIVVVLIYERRAGVSIYGNGYDRKLVTYVVIGFVLAFKFTMLHTVFYMIFYYSMNSWFSFNSDTPVYIMANSISLVVLFWVCQYMYGRLIEILEYKWSVRSNDDITEEGKVAEVVDEEVEEGVDGVDGITHKLVDAVDSTSVLVEFKRIRYLLFRLIGFSFLTGIFFTLIFGLVNPLLIYNVPFVWVIVFIFVILKCIGFIKSN